MKTYRFDDPAFTLEEREEAIRALAERFRAASTIVFLTGAGTSTESGIPDFRSPTGIYATASASLFEIDRFYEDPEAFYREYAPFYRKMREAKPNAGHKAIADLERRGGKRVEVVTQNIDGLHARAGSSATWEVHGTIRTATCVACGRRREESEFSADVMSGRAPRCECGGVFKPDVTFFGEELPAQAFAGAQRAMWEAKLLVIAGTSLQVYPAAGLPRECDAGTPFVIINATPTDLDFQSSLVYRAKIGEVLPAAVSAALGVE